MLRNLLILLIAESIITGCEQKKSIPEQPLTPLHKDFFPVTQYLLGQINELSGLPVTPLKLTTIDGKTDSTWLKREEIKSFTFPFISPVIDSVSLNNYFSETSFLDQTINAITFSYDPATELPDSITVKRWDVYVDPVSNEVKRVYILKKLNDGKSVQTIQLTWKTGNYCQVTTIIENNKAAPKFKEEKLIWNFND